MPPKCRPCCAWRSVLSSRIFRLRQRPLQCPRWQALSRLQVSPVSAVPPVRSWWRYSRPRRIEVPWRLCRIRLSMKSPFPGQGKKQRAFPPAALFKCPIRITAQPVRSATSASLRKMGRTLIRVLLLQIGHSTHFSFPNAPPPKTDYILFNSIKTCWHTCPNKKHYSKYSNSKDCQPNP